jgi:NDP-sugar pyrophosphorylase family protein
LVILTCFASCEPFGFLTRQIPAAMLPVLNKPLVEHLLEQCADCGFTRVRVALVEHPMPTRQFLGHGERWGLDVHTWDFREPCPDDVLVSRLASGHTGPVVVIPAETLIDMDLKGLLAFHEHGQQSVTRVMARDECHRLGTRASREHMPDEASDKRMHDTGIRVINSPAGASESSSTFEFTGKWVRVDNPTRLWEANTAALHGDFPRILPSTSVAGQQHWVGHHCRIDPTSTIEAPVFIGNHACIGSGVHVKSASVIGNGVIIDSNALVESSVVLDHTYVGTYINMVDRIASGKYVFNIREGSVLRVDDPIIVSGLREKILGPAARRLTDKAIALALFVATSPIWMLKGFGRLVRGNRFFDVRASVIAEGVPDESVLQWSSRVNLLRFNDAHPFVSRLPGLWDVVSGRLALVGVRPLSEEEMARLKEDWTLLRFESPAGLFTMLDTLDSQDLDEDEKVVIENYYASTRKLSSDVTILCQAVIKLVLSR